MTMTDHDCVWISSCACFALLGTKAAAIVVQRAPADWPPRQLTTPTAFGLGLALGVIDGGSRNLPLVSTIHYPPALPLALPLVLPLAQGNPSLSQYYRYPSTSPVPACRPTLHPTRPARPLWTRRPPAETPRTPFGIAAQSPSVNHYSLSIPSPGPRALINVSMLARGRSPPAASDLAACMFRPKPYCY
jgi:hypothetical protein